MSDVTRREALRTMSAVAGSLPFFARTSEAQLASTSAEAHRRVAASGSYQLESFSPEQNAVAAVMSDLIIPATETPGAADVRVNEFMDVMVTKWFHADERRQFLAGLDEVNATAVRDHGHPFVDCTPSQRLAIVSELDAALVRQLDRGEPVDDMFYYQFKRLTLTGYYTSEAGMTEELGWEMIPGAYRACEPVQDLRRG